MFIICYFHTNAQFSFVISHLSAHYYNVGDHKYIINEDYEQGPLVGATCIIKNTSADTITLYPNKSRIYFCFSYQGYNYKQEGFPLEFIEKKSITLFPNDSIEFGFGNWILLGLGSDVYNYKKYNYTKEMLEILPTIRVLYQQDDLRLYTNRILSVIVSEK